MQTTKFLVQCGCIPRHNGTAKTPYSAVPFSVVPGGKTCNIRVLLYHLPLECECIKYVTQDRVTMSPVSGWLLRS